MAEVKFENVTKAFGETVAVRDLDLEIHDKEFLVLVGPSGCGKTTTLRMLAGLEDTTKGRIYIDGKDVTFLPPKDRDIAMVFQSYALYPHMNVYDNMAFGLRNRLISTGMKQLRAGVTLVMWLIVIAIITVLSQVAGMIFGKPFYSMMMFGGIGAFFLALSLYPDFRLTLTWKGMIFLSRYSNLARDYIRIEKTIEERVKWAAEILEIPELLKRKPRQLSGGQRQRVALGRAMVRQPKVFLMDEPLSNLDAKLRNSMRAELASLQSKLEITTVYVTHDQVEAMTLGHRIAVMNKGVIEQIGTPDEVYSRPETLFVAGFIGTPTMNFIRGKIESDQNGLKLVSPGISLLLSESELGKRYQQLKQYIGKDVVLGIRPENVKIETELEKAASLPGIVTFVEPIGSVTNLFFEIGRGEKITVSVEGYRKIGRGDSSTLFFPYDMMHFFNPTSGKRIC